MTGESAARSALLVATTGALGGVLGHLFAGPRSTDRERARGLALGATAGAAFGLLAASSVRATRLEPAGPGAPTYRTY